jgi:hypothetical protein
MRQCRYPDWVRALRNGKRAVFSSSIPSCPITDVTKIVRAVSADMKNKEVEDGKGQMM